MDSAIIKAKGISFSYGNTTILDNVSFHVKPGEFLGVVGPNGSGKSTLVKICLGLIKAQKGSLELFGRDINLFKDWGKIGYIPQKATSFNQGFPATVEEVVAANLYPIVGLFSQLKSEHKEMVDEVLNTVGMYEYKKRLIGRLSGGQQQRVFIAKSLISDPKVIFMDEPTVGIDSKSEENFYTLMEYLNKEKGITLVMITHDVGAISNRIDKVICVSEGKLYEHGCSINEGSHELKDVFEHSNKRLVSHSH